MTDDKQRADFGVVGMAVMGRNLALNIADRGVAVAVWSRDPQAVAQAVQESGGALQGVGSLEALVARLDAPRRIMLMIKAGPPVDEVLGHLAPLLAPGDVVIDGGNSWFEDTQRRQRELAAQGLRYLGVGVSGGEEGARHGPSLMPGGDADAYALVRPIFEAMAARTDSGPCVTHVGPDGAGHFVKMVHNGIEYADMQFIAEAYHLLRELRGLGPARLAEVFAGWNQGPLESFLIEITAKIFTVKDPQGDGFLVDAVLDRAGQKGTGKWTVQAALGLGVPVPSIAAAVDARILSSQKDARLRYAPLLAGPGPVAGEPPTEAAIHDALYAAKVGAYAQGMALIRAASEAEGWGVDAREIARIWKGGCIIRARFLDTMMQAWAQDPGLENLLLDPAIRGRVDAAQPAWRQVVAAALGRGVPVPGMAASLAYYDALRTGDLPQNLIQAQRDAFGAHTYQRVDDPDGPFVHSEWL